RLVLVEVELDLRAVRIIKEQLPNASPGKAAQLVLDPFAFQRLDRPRQILGAERHVVEHAGPLLGQRIAMDHVQYRRVVVGIEPPSRKLEGRPPTDLEAEEITVEPARRLEIVAQDGEMVHCGYTHWKNSFTPAVDTADAYPEAGCSVNDGVF